MEKLRNYLASIPTGPVTGTEDLESLLNDCWEQFEGGDEESMAAYKLVRRMEHAEWNPPLLSFTIERHGGTVLGSTRADLHRWQLNVDTGTARWRPAGFRQLEPRQPNLDVKPLAEEIVQLIVDHKQDPRLLWDKAGNVHIQTGKIIPQESAVNATVQGRRKRLRLALTELIKISGWHEVRTNVYSPPLIG